MVSAWKCCSLHPNGLPGPPRLYGRPDICLNEWLNSFYSFIYIFTYFSNESQKDLWSSCDQPIKEDNKTATKKAKTNKKVSCQLLMVVLVGYVSVTTHQNSHIWELFQPQNFSTAFRSLLFIKTKRQHKGEDAE